MPEQCKLCETKPSICTTWSILGLSGLPHKVEITKSVNRIFEGNIRDDSRKQIGEGGADLREAQGGGMPILFLSRLVADEGKQDR
jgi:putative component of toxin-antitoxin plasmid stabilization module